MSGPTAPDDPANAAGLPPAAIFESRALDALAARELFELLRLRVDVFVVEQACPYPELDDIDIHPGTRHVLGRVDGRLVACARTVPPASPATPARIGRVAVHEDHRGGGLARALMRWALAGLAREHPGHDVTLGAQVAVERFYGSLGFGRVSDEYLEDGIVHVDMTRRAFARDSV